MEGLYIMRCLNNVMYQTDEQGIVGTVYVEILNKMMKLYVYEYP